MTVEVLTGGTAMMQTIVQWFVVQMLEQEIYQKFP